MVHARPMPESCQVDQAAALDKGAALAIGDRVHNTAGHDEKRAGDDRARRLPEPYTEGYDQCRKKKRHKQVEQSHEVEDRRTPPSAIIFEHAARSRPRRAGGNTLAEPVADCDDMAICIVRRALDQSGPGEKDPQGPSRSQSARASIHRGRRKPSDSSARSDGKGARAASLLPRCASLSSGVRVEWRALEARGGQGGEVDRGDGIRESYRRVERSRRLFGKMHDEDKDQATNIPPCGTFEEPKRAGRASTGLTVRKS